VNTTEVQRCKILGHIDNRVVKKYYLDPRANVDLQSLSQKREPNDFKDFRALENNRFPGVPCLPADRKKAALDVQEFKDLNEECRRLQTNHASQFLLECIKGKIDVLRARLLRNARKKFRAEWRRDEALRYLSKKDAVYSPKPKTALHPDRALVVDLLYTVDGPSTERDLKLVLALRDLCLSQPRKAKSNIPREPGEPRILTTCKLWEPETRTWRKVESRRGRKASSRNSRALLPKCDSVAAPPAAIQDSPAPPAATQQRKVKNNSRILLPKCDSIAAPQVAVQHSPAPPAATQQRKVKNNSRILLPKCDSIAAPPAATQRKVKNNSRILLPKCNSIAAPQVAIQHSLAPPAITQRKAKSRRCKSPHQRMEPKHIEEKCDFIVAPQPATQHLTAPQLMDKLLYVHNDGLLLPTQGAYESGKPKYESGHNGSIKHPCCETNCIRHLNPFGTKLDMEVHWRKNHDLNLVTPCQFLIFNCPESNCIHHRKEFRGRMELFRHWKGAHCFKGTTTEAPQDFKRLVESVLG
jgi:RNase P protein component